MKCLGFGEEGREWPGSELSGRVWECTVGALPAPPVKFPKEKYPDFQLGLYLSRQEGFI